MSLSKCLYIVDMLSNLDAACAFIFVALAIFLIIFGVITLCKMDDYDYCNHKEKCDSYINKGWKFIYKKSWMIFILLILSIIIPSQKTMYMMLGSAYLSSTGIPTKVQEVLELKLDDVVRDLKNKSIHAKETSK